jgi:tol-pal system protein YbgF
MNYARTVLTVAFIGAASLLAPKPAAALFGDDEARQAILDLRKKVQENHDELLKRVNDLTSRVDRLESSAAPKSGQLELSNDITALRQEIDRLRGQLETQTNQLVELQKKHKDLAGDFDNRMKKFEPVSTNIDGNTVAVDQNERKAFDAALATFRAGDFKNALTAFQGFQSAYPQSPFLAQSQYWIGSAQFAMRDYKAAIQSHQLLVRNHPESPRVPDAMLTIANSLAELNDKKGARSTLQQIIEKHAATPAAEMAKERLAELK